jgi:biotin carboxyl carrier protein
LRAGKTSWIECQRVEVAGVSGKLLKLILDIGGKTRKVEIARADGKLRFLVDGKPLEADAVEVARGIYSILIGGESFEVRTEAAVGKLRVISRGREIFAVFRDPRQWRRRGGAALEAEGRQQIIAPMPGKIVRVLVKAGDPVETGQGLLVVEAMKMQNEIRSPKSGKVERLSVVEGQAVNAGEVVAVVA